MFIPLSMRMSHNHHILFVHCILILDMMKCHVKKLGQYDLDLQFHGQINDFILSHAELFCLKAKANIFCVYKYMT